MKQSHVLHTSLAYSLVYIQCEASQQALIRVPCTLIIQIATKKLFLLYTTGMAISNIKMLGRHSKLGT